MAASSFESRKIKIFYFRSCLKRVNAQNICQSLRVMLHMGIYIYVHYTYIYLSILIISIPYQEQYLQ